MTDPRIPRGEPQVWPKTAVDPRVCTRTPLRIIQMGLPCPSCRKGMLVANGETHDSGNLHICDQANCGEKWIIPGEPFPRRVEELDIGANLMRG